jgi:hypothetical protein
MGEQTRRRYPEQVKTVGDAYMVASGVDEIRLRRIRGLACRLVEVALGATAAHIVSGLATRQRAGVHESWPSRSTIGAASLFGRSRVNEERVIMPPVDRLC